MSLEERNEMMEYKTKKLSADVLVVGGGIGGLTAAVTIKEKNPDLDVLIVEKQTAGYSGKANKGGGVLQYFNLDEVSPEQFTEFHVHNVGAYLGDQDMMKKYVSMNNIMLEKLSEWGVRVPRDEDGRFKVVQAGPMTGMIGVDLDITIKVRQTVEKKGVKIIDKVTISDLLTAGGRIAGAVGYSILDGTFYEISAKEVILASGSQNYRFAPMWSNGRGDGIAAAYRAGAEMRNPEFGNFAQLMKVKSHQEVVFGENVMYNGLGDNVTKNFRRFRETDINANTLAEWYNQMSAGRGPIVLHPDESEELKGETMMFTLWDRPYGLPLWETIYNKAAAADQGSFEMVATFIGEQSPVKVGHDMQTTIPGLYAIGDVSYCGSTAPGAVPAPPGRNRGSGILNAVFTGIISGEEAAAAAPAATATTADPAQVEAARQRAYEPLQRKEGVRPKDLIAMIHEVICPMENTVYMTEYRLNIALRKLEKIKALVPKLAAKDFHVMLECHEAEAMVLSAEMQLRASLMRKESRGWFLREDYPRMDNGEWLKWITVRNESGEMVFGTEDVPVDKWDVKPPPMPPVMKV